MSLTGEQLAAIRASATEILIHCGQLRFFDCWDKFSGIDLRDLDQFAHKSLRDELSIIAEVMGFEIAERKQPVSEPPAVTSEPGFDGRATHFGDDDCDINWGR